MPHIVCGYYTPDYVFWARALIETLDRHEQPHDFVEVPKIAGSWEVNLLAKPRHLLGAMRRHSDKTIVWLDVDCTVHGDLSPLAEIPGDIGLRYNIKKRKGRALLMRAQAGTVVVQPTTDAKRFVEIWHEKSQAAPYGEDDEATLTQTIVATPDVSITQLDLKWVSVGTRRAADPVVVHASASRDTPKVRKLARFLYRHLRVPAFERAA